MDIRERSYVNGYGNVDSRVVDYMNDYGVDIEEASLAVGYGSYKEAMSTEEEKKWDAKILKELETDGYFDDLVREQVQHVKNKYCE